MAVSKDEVIEFIANMSVLELSAMIKELEEKFGVSAAAPVAVAAAPLEVITKPAPELPKVAFQALEETPLHSVVQSAGMIWVATDSSKHADAQSQIQAEPVAHNLGRAPKPAASLPDGPMVLVETGGQEKTV